MWGGDGPCRAGLLPAGGFYLSVVGAPDGGVFCELMNVFLCGLTAALAEGFVNKYSVSVQ